MSRFKQLLHTIAVSTLLLAYCSISPAALAARPGKASAPWVGTTVQGKECRGAKIPFGPFDYLQRDQRSGDLFIVEEYHFTPEIEALQQGTATAAINDIQYTLMAWPNHHRALNSAIQYRLKKRGDWYEGIVDINAPTPAECLLQRAMNFSPNDPIPYMLHGILMHTFKDYESALESFRAANRLLPEDILTQYNMGLTLVALKEYGEARKIAKSIYQKGFPLPGLKNKLKAAGQWDPKPKNAAKKKKKASKPSYSAAQLEALNKAIAADVAAGKEVKPPEIEIGPRYSAAQMEALIKAIEADVAAGKAVEPPEEVIEPAYSSAQLEAIKKAIEANPELQQELQASESARQMPVPNESLPGDEGIDPPVVPQ